MIHGVFSSKELSTYFLETMEVSEFSLSLYCTFISFLFKNKETHP